MRCTVKELKDFLKDLSDDLKVYVDSYNSNHHREFLYVREHMPDGRTSDLEFQIAKVNFDEDFDN